MGAFPSHTLPVTDEAPTWWDQHPVLQQYAIEKTFVTGSGRLFRTYRVRHRTAETVAIVKTAWLEQKSNDDGTSSTEQVLATLQQDLLTLQEAARECSAVWPYKVWCDKAVGPTKRAVALLRPHVYTTLRERCNSRPFWNAAEKTYATVQLLQAVQHWHDRAGRAHGHLCASNVGVTSVGRLVLLDGWSALKKTFLPVNDPTEYLYYFQTTRYAGSGGGTEETPCCLAPERFVTTVKDKDALPTPAMDLFAVGCLVVEIGLGGDALFGNLGQLLAYKQGDETAVAQKLAKLESSAMRAAAKHMLSRNPTDRLSAAGYLERLEATGQLPKTVFGLLDGLIQGDDVTPDARLVHCVKVYPEMVHAALGRRLSAKSQEQWQCWMSKKENTRDSQTTRSSDSIAKITAFTQANPVFNTDTMDFTQLLAETEALLQSLEEPVVESTVTTRSSDVLRIADSKEEISPEEADSERSELCQNSLIIYLQIIVSTLRHVQRPASKWISLQLVQDLSARLDDAARLARVVPVTVSLLQDSDALVRATALQVLTTTVAQVSVFAPSDAALFGQYIHKRVQHLSADPALVVRMAFCQCFPTLAQVAQRFLDVSHAVRLYEAVVEGQAGGTSSSSAALKRKGSGTSSGYNTASDDEDAVFSEDVAQLLDKGGEDGATNTSSSDKHNLGSSKTLLGSAYLTERENLYDTVSRWVVHMATDQSEDASLPKRAMLKHMDRLCNFFGQQGVMSLLLPQIVTFLNDRKDWQLRAALFENLTPVCQKIGRAATEEFVLPCLEIGFIDLEEQVIRCALMCLSRLVELGLLSRASLVGTTAESNMNVRTGNPSLLDRYAIFLMHPCDGIRRTAISVFVRACRALGSPDHVVYVLPILKPLLKYQPTVQHLLDAEKLEKCLQSAWTREEFQRQIDRFATHRSGAWTTVGFQVTDGAKPKTKETNTALVEDNPLAQIRSFKEYLRMLSMHNNQMPSMETSQQASSRGKGVPSIEANLKLAQSVMFPRQEFRTARAYLPEWYEKIQKQTMEESSGLSPQSAITSIAALGAVYGISIMGPVEGIAENIIGAAAEDGTRQESVSETQWDKESAEIVEAASLGQWSAESVLDPDVIDASLLVSKLKALGVPQLPPKLGEHFVSQNPPASTKHTIRGATKDTPPTEWRPRINSLVATSSTISGHKAPVVRLAVSVDSSFFVSASHDGTCGVWETAQLEDSVGVLDSSLVYSGHTEHQPARINDVAMVEGTHSVVSGDSNGSVHVWRVDMVQSTGTQSWSRNARTVGSSEIRQMQPGEGEILAVTHFTGLSSSVLMFATQKGTIHSWDLRCAQEPFLLHHSPGLGHLTTMALGNDRQWLVSGTNKGYVALWDVRFQNAVKLWRHESGEKIHRVATSFVPPPQNWAGRFANSEPRPFVFLGTGANECAMFDLISGSCRECFRTVWADSKLQNEGIPCLVDITISAASASKTLAASGPQFQSPTISSYPSVNCMVGSVGGQNQSFLVTGGSDRRIRFWDFASPSRCYAVAGETSSSTRSSYERIDFDGPRRLMLCRQPPALALRESIRIGNYAYQGLKKPQNNHTDAVMDLKIIDNGLVSCSRDCTVKVWR